MRGKDFENAYALPSDWQVADTVVKSFGLVFQFLRMSTALAVNSSIKLVLLMPGNISRVAHEFRQSLALFLNYNRLS